MKIKITADSTCDLSQALLDQYQITIIPLYVMKDGRAYRDGMDIVPSDIFLHVDLGGVCTTAAANISDYAAKFVQYAADYDAVIHISIGAGFSYSYQNACVAAQVHDNVYIIDSKNLSTGQGHLVIEASKLAKSGMDAKTICKELNNMTDRVKTSFLIDSPDYLYKGGRCSLLSAIGAKILHFKQCIEVSNGKMHIGNKYRGTFERCVEAYVRDCLYGRKDLKTDRIFVTHASAPRKSIVAAKNEIRNNASFREIIETQAGCVISCHCGPSTLGVLFMLA